MKGWYLFEALSSINEEGDLHILIIEAVQKFARTQGKLPVTKDKSTLSRLAARGNHYPSARAKTPALHLKLIPS